MKYFNKKNTQNKETTKLPMTGKLKKGFRSEEHTSELQSR